MCQEKWYRYTCGVILFQQERGLSIATDGLEDRTKADCSNYDPNNVHATNEVDSKCQECAYPTPPTSDSDDDDG